MYESFDTMYEVLLNKVDGIINDKRYLISVYYEIARDDYSFSLIELSYEDEKETIDRYEGIVRPSFGNGVNVGNYIPMTTSPINRQLQIVRQSMKDALT